MGNAERFQANVTDTVLRNFYLDDLLKSLKTSDDAIKMYEKVNELLLLGGFHLTKWTINKREVLDEIPESQMTKELKNTDLDIERLLVETALGMQWNLETDQFQYNIMVEDKQFTRREMLNIISSIYDPVGYVSLVIFQVKLLLQRLCSQKLGWDAAIPNEQLVS